MGLRVFGCGSMLSGLRFLRIRRVSSGCGTLTVPRPSAVSTPLGLTPRRATMPVGAFAFYVTVLHFLSTSM